MELILVVGSVVGDQHVRIAERRGDAHACGRDAPERRAGCESQPFARCRGEGHRRLGLRGARRAAPSREARARTPRAHRTSRRPVRPASTRSAGVSAPASSHAVATAGMSSRPQLAADVQAPRRSRWWGFSQMSMPAPSPIASRSTGPARGPGRGSAGSRGAVGAARSSAPARSFPPDRDEGAQQPSCRATWAPGPRRGRGANRPRPAGRRA